MPFPSLQANGTPDLDEIIRRQLFDGVFSGLERATSGQGEIAGAPGPTGAPRPSTGFLEPLTPEPDGMVTLRGGSTPTPPPIFMGNMPTADGLVTLSGGPREPPGLVDAGDGLLRTNPMWMALQKAKAARQEAESQDAEDEAQATQRRVAALGEQEQARKATEDEVWDQAAAIMKQRAANGLARIGQGGAPRTTRKPRRP